MPKHLKANRWQHAAVILSLLLLALALENFDKLLVMVNLKTLPQEESLFGLAPIWYQRLTTAGYRAPRSHFVRLVTLSPEGDPREVLTNVCKQRLFLSRLITRLDQARAALIVLDKHFPDDACIAAEDIDATRKLADALMHSRTPIILGLATGDETPSPNGICLPVPDHLLTFGAEVQSETNSMKKIELGITRTNKDTRKLPLEWPLCGKKPAYAPTLSLAAARRFDRDLFQSQRLKQLADANEHPFASFLREDQFTSYSAFSVLCGKSTDKNNWRACDPDAGRGDAVRDAVDDFDVAGKIVLIGDRLAGIDRHDSVVGSDVPGIILHANYIEALLDDRFFRPFSWISSVAAYLFWLVAIYLSFWLAKSPEHAVLLCSGLFLLLWLTSYLALVQCGYFFSVWLQSASFVAVLLKWVEARGHHSWETH